MNYSSDCQLIFKIELHVYLIWYHIYSRMMNPKRHHLKKKPWGSHIGKNWGPSNLYKISFSFWDETSCFSNTVSTLREMPDPEDSQGASFHGSTIEYMLFYYFHDIASYNSIKCHCISIWTMLWGQSNTSLLFWIKKHCSYNNIKWDVKVPAIIFYSDY